MKQLLVIIFKNVQLRNYKIITYLFKILIKKIINFKFLKFYKIILRYKFF